MTTPHERIEGGLVGLLVGDALGVPYEFEKIPALEQIEFVPPRGHWHAWPGTPPGTWSDDGAQALCLLVSLLHCGCLDPEDLAKRLLRCHTEGYLWVDGRVFDTGVTTAEALRTYRAGRPALEAGPAGERDNGNGSLMRVLPLALWHKGTDHELVGDARAQSRVTHGHLRAQLCCALYCLWARRTLEGSAEPWQAAVAALRALYHEGAEERRELDEHIQPDAPAQGEGTGYVVDCLHSARLAVAAGPFEVAVKAAVALGEDTDTTAAVTGGIAGLRDGVHAIPLRWREELRGREMYQPLLERLLGHAISSGA
jgi:ADP-ribosyl-[dinitrogen reductase] hydrolase